jgi:hypothetical protein
MRQEQRSRRVFSELEFGIPVALDRVGRIWAGIFYKSSTKLPRNKTSEKTVKRPSLISSVSGFDAKVPAELDNDAKARATTGSAISEKKL